jgi:hypothetical protein
MRILDEMAQEIRQIRERQCDEQCKVSRRHGRAGNIREFHVAAVKKLAPDVELVGVPISMPRAPRPAPRVGTTAYGHGRWRRRANVIRLTRPRRTGWRRGARARLPRADR